MTENNENEHEMKNIAGSGNHGTDIGLVQAESDKGGNDGLKKRECRKS